MSFGHKQGSIQSSSAGSTVPYVVERIMSQGSLNNDRVFIASGKQLHLISYLKKLKAFRIPIQRIDRFAQLDKWRC